MFSYKHAETKFIKCNKRGGGGWNKGGPDFYYFYKQNLLICNTICLQTCFTNFWKGKLSKIRKQSLQLKYQVSSNQTRMPSEGVVQCTVSKSIDLFIFDPMPSEGVVECTVSKSIDLFIFDPMQQVRLHNERPDSSAIFKEISKAHATHFTEEDIENSIEGLTNKKKTC